MDILRGREDVMPAKFDRCVRKVKAKSGKKVNPYAVCNASMGKGKKKKHKR